LADLREQDAVPVLIALLTELRQAEAGQAESFLRDLAGGEAPKTSLGSTDLSRKKCRLAWETWWRKADGRPLLERFRRATPSEADREKVQALISRMGDDDF